MARRRREIHFSGRVQGVGFRYATSRCAASHQVTGWVKNLPDGRVQVVVEGEPEEIGRFVEDLQVRMSDYIRDRRERESDASGEFRDFEIRY